MLSKHNLQVQGSASDNFCIPKDNCFSFFFFCYWQVYLRSIDKSFKECKYVFFFVLHWVCVLIFQRVYEKNSTTKTTTSTVCKPMQLTLFRKLCYLPWTETLTGSIRDLTSFSLACLTVLFSIKLIFMSQPLEPRKAISFWKRSHSFYV